MTYDNENEIIEVIFESPLSRYQIDLETSMKGSNFAIWFDLTVVLKRSCNKF